MSTDEKDASTLHSTRFPGESAEYRAARDRLLREEAALRRHVEEVAALRRALPPGGPGRELVSAVELLDRGRHANRRRWRRAKCQRTAPFSEKRKFCSTRQGE